MNESRRGFVAKAALVGAVAAVGVVSAQASSSSSKGIRKHKHGKIITNLPYKRGGIELWKKQPNVL
jgi:nitrous oxide reductase